MTSHNDIETDVQGRPLICNNCSIEIPLGRIAETQAARDGVDARHTCRTCWDESILQGQRDQRVRELLSRIPEPPLGAVIVDGDGNVWHRLDAGWHCACPWPTAWTWIDILCEFGIVHVALEMCEISRDAAEITGGIDGGA